MTHSQKQTLVHTPTAHIVMIQHLNLSTVHKVYLINLANSKLIIFSAPCRPRFMEITSPSILLCNHDPASKHHLDPPHLHEWPNLLSSSFSCIPMLCKVVSLLPRICGELRSVEKNAAIPLPLHIDCRYTCRYNADPTCVFFPTEAIN